MTNKAFRDRKEAGKLLANMVYPERGEIDIILGISNGGVLCSLEVANLLNKPHEILVVKKIKHPHSNEYAVGAVSEDRVVVKRRETSVMDQEWLDDQIERLNRALSEQKQILKNNRPPICLKNSRVLIVDDGLATGTTIMTAVEYARKHGAKNVMAAVPVSSAEGLEKISGLVDKKFILKVIDDFISVSDHYVDFKNIEISELQKMI